MSKILQKSNIIVQQEPQKVFQNEHNAIMDKFNELTTRLEEKVDKVNQLEQDLQQTKEFYGAIIEEIEKKLSSLLIIK